MHISHRDVEKAVLKIFWDLRIPSGSGLRHSMLIKEWAYTPLRRGDLEPGIRRLAAMQYLRPERTPDGEIVLLTPVGREYSEEMFRDTLHNLLLRLRMSVLSLARWRRADEPRSEPGRRQIDRIAPEPTWRVQHQNDNYLRKRA